MAGEINTSYNADFAAAVNAGAQLLGSTMNGLLASINSDADRKYNTRVRAENRQWALEDYERILKDSSPLANMNRLREAGLNPNLVYGTGNIQSGTTMMPREASLPDLHRRPFQIDLATMNAMGNYLDLKLKEAEIKKTEAESNKVQSETTGQNLANEFNQATMDIRIALESNRNYEVLTNIRKMDSDIRNQSFLTDSNIRLNNEQIESIIQARYVQWEELELTKSQIGAQIKQGYMHAQAALKSAGAAQLNAAGNYLKATSDAIRNSKLNELTDRQIGFMALEHQRLSIDMQYDAARHESEEFKRQEYQRTRDNWNKNWSWTGLSFDDFRSLIPFAPSVEHSSKNVTTGESTKWKF